MPRRQWHGEFLSQHGRHDAARSELDRAMELDPLSLVIMSDSAWTYYQAGDYSSCIRQTDRTLEFEQTWKAAIGAKIGCYEALGDFEAALDSYALLIPTEKSDADRKRLVEDIDYVRKLTRTDGAKGYWRAYLEIERRKPAEQQEHLFLATCLTQLGDLEGCSSRIRKGCRDRRKLYRYNEGRTYVRPASRPTAISGYAGPSRPKHRVLARTNLKNLTSPLRIRLFRINFTTFNRHYSIHS
ncbi:MAG: hypothetical protein IPP63_12825 [Chloracidobacterium sp.]|nr:hypothetical protein [Chloracidobacterium sp.]